MAKSRNPRRGAQSRAPTTNMLRAAMQRAVKALSHVRKGKSLTSAARLAHTSASTVLKYAGGALRKANGVYVAQPVDSAPRLMKLMTPSGLIAETIVGSRSASRVATYMNAVKHYLLTGDASRVRAFAGQAVRAAGKRIPFVTDLRTLRRLEYANEIAFEDLYGDVV